MRVSIPGMMILSAMCFCSYVKYAQHKWCSWALLLGLAIGAIVPSREMAIYLKCLCNLGVGIVVEDHIVTFDRDLDLIKRFGDHRGEWIASFCNATDVDSTFFFGYLAKRK